MSPDSQQSRYVSSADVSHLDAGAGPAPSVDAFLRPTRLSPAVDSPTSAAVPIDIQLVGELNEWQSTVRMAVLQYLWLRSVLERGARFRQRLERGAPSITDVRDDLDALDEAFYRSPCTDKTWPPQVSGALTQMRELLDAPDGPYLNARADMNVFYTETRRLLAQGLTDVQRALAQLEQQARDAVEHLGSVVDVIFRNARDAQTRAEEERVHQFARALGQGASKPNVTPQALARGSDDADAKTLDAGMLAGSTRYQRGVP